MATIKDIATRARVTPSTVSEVLNGKGRVSAPTRARVLAVAQAMGYRPNELARALRVRQTRTIGLVIPSVTNPFYPALARGAEDAAFAAGHDLLLCNSDRDPDKEQAYIASLLDKWVDAIIFAAPIVGPDDLLKARSRRAAVVVMNASVPDPEVDEIWVDYRDAARSAVEFLVDLGHERIGFIGGPTAIRRFADRLEGYRDVLAARGLFRDRLVRIGGYDHDTGYVLGRALCELNPRPTALFCANDVIALGALAAAIDLGLQVPRDLSIVGFDDIPLASVIRPQLTTVRQPSYEAGKLAAELALARVSGGPHRPKQRRYLATELIVRTSTAPPSSRAGSGRGEGQVSPRAATATHRNGAERHRGGDREPETSEPAG
jgi:LacI family transcriptional regulator